MSHTEKKIMFTQYFYLAPDISIPLKSLLPTHYMATLPTTFKNEVCHPQANNFLPKRHYQAIRQTERKFAYKLVVKVGKKERKKRCSFFPLKMKT